MFQSSTSASVPLPPTDVPEDGAADSTAFSAPLLLWLTLQMGALASAAMRVPLSANYPEAGERFALDVMLMAQIGSVSILSGLLVRNWRIAVICAVTAWPFVAVAAVLSATSAFNAATAGLIVTLWIAILASWSVAFPVLRSRLILAAIASLWAIGGPIVYYLHAEFAAPGLPVPFSPRYGPAVVAWSAGVGGLSAGDGWAIGIFSCTGGLAWIIPCIRRRAAERQVTGK